MEHQASHIADRPQSAEIVLNQAVRISIQKLGAVAAMSFLKSPNKDLNGLRPLDVLKMPNGLRRVEHLLDQIAR